MRQTRTHFAVALRYVREEGGAPQVIAKGQDLIALKIREIAVAHGIPVIEDKGAGALSLQSGRGRQDDPGGILQGGGGNRLLRARPSGPDKARWLENGMLRQGNTYTLQREKALADGLRDVAAELRLIDATDLVAFLRTEQFANIANLVNSFQRIVLQAEHLELRTFPATCSLKWGEAPALPSTWNFATWGWRSISVSCCRRFRRVSISTTSPLRRARRSRREYDAAGASHRRCPVDANFPRQHRLPASVFSST